MFQYEICRENQNTHFFSLTFFFWKSCRLWDKVEKCCRTGQATDDNCVLGTYTHTHSGCVVLIAFPLQQWLHGRSSKLRYCLPSFFLSFFDLCLPTHCRCRGYCCNWSHLVTETLKHEHTHTHLVGLPWTRGTTPSWDRHPRPRLDSNPQTHQASGCRPTPEIARPSVSVTLNTVTADTVWWRRKWWQFATAVLMLRYVSAERFEFGRDVNVKRNPDVFSLDFQQTFHQCDRILISDWSLRKGLQFDTACLIKYTCRSQYTCFVQLTDHIQVCYTNYFQHCHCLYHCAS